MKKILLKILLCFLFSCSILFCLTACNNGQPSIKGTEIYSETLTVDNQAKTIYGKLPNGTESYEVSKNIRVAEDATYHLCSDILGQNAIVSKTAVLETGDNVYYLIVENNNEIETYTLTLRVKPLYKVSFDIQPECFISKNTSSNDNPGVIIGGSSLISIVDTQLVEEDAVAVVPEQPTRLGCEFIGWDFDFSQKISTDITIKAKWKRNAEMAYFEFKSDSSRCEIVKMVRYNKNAKLIIPEYITSISSNFSFLPSDGIYYEGTAEEWKNISSLPIYIYPKQLIYLYSEEEPTLGGFYDTYWYYENGVPTIWPNMDN